MKNWLKALLSETAFALWWIVSAFSTLSTFFLKGLAGKPRLVSAISTILGFAWANYRVFQKQQADLLGLRDTLAHHEERVSRLRIAPDDGSRYILHPVNNVLHADFKGGVFEFHLMIENAGRRNSTVDTYQVEIVELQQTFPNLRPMEGINSVQGRHCQCGMHPDRILSTTGNIRIEAENATDHGVLLLPVPGINLEQFAMAGLHMHGDEKRFGPLHCRLTLTDMTQVSDTCEFSLNEA